MCSKATREEQELRTRISLPSGKAPTRTLPFLSLLNPNTKSSTSTRPLLAAFADFLGDLCGSSLCSTPRAKLLPYVTQLWNPTRHHPRLIVCSFPSFSTQCSPHSAHARGWSFLPSDSCTCSGDPPTSVSTSRFRPFLQHSCVGSGFRSRAQSCWRFAP